MKLVKSIIVIFVVLVIQSECLAGDYPEVVSKFLKSMSEAYTEHSFVKSYDDILNSTNFVWKKQIVLKAKKPFTNRYGQKVYQRLYFSFYWYGDGSSCAEAFSKFLDCFGAACVKLERGRDIEAMETIPTFVVFARGRIAIVRTHCEHLRDAYDEVKRKLKQMMGNYSIQTMDAGCGGPIIWDVMRKEERL